MRLSKHRVEGLSDGVFSIIMTLLVLEVRVRKKPKRPCAVCGVYDCHQFE